MPPRLKRFSKDSGIWLWDSRVGKILGEGLGHPLQYSWASLVAQLVKNPPAVWETWVQSLGWEDPLEKGKATHSHVPAWRNSMDCIVRGVANSRIRLSGFPFTMFHKLSFILHGYLKT